MLATASMDVAMRALGRLKTLGDHSKGTVLNTTVVSSILNVVTLAVIADLTSSSMGVKVILVGVIKFFMFSNIMKFIFCGVCGG